jgi:hypothetical protein
MACFSLTSNFHASESPRRCLFSVSLIIRCADLIKIYFSFTDTPLETFTAGG